MTRLRQDFSKPYVRHSLITFNNRAQYGQVVFLAGGAASGKDFAINKFIDAASYKVFDVDRLAELFIVRNEVTQKYPQFVGFDWKNPYQVKALHEFMSKRKLNKTQLAVFFADKGGKDTLPNIIFNATMKDIGYMEFLMPILTERGYQPENIHICWVLQRFEVALQLNQQRSRTVPEAVLMKAHEGAFQTMYNLIMNSVSRGVNGSISVIFGGIEHTLVWLDQRKSPIKNSKQQTTVKEFSYCYVKQPRLPIDPESEAVAKVIGWMLDAVPRESMVPELL